MSQPEESKVQSGTFRAAARIMTTLAATTGAFLLAVGMATTPAHAATDYWGSYNCGSQYVYTQSFSAGYTWHQSQITGYTDFISWNAPATGQWNTRHLPWHSVVNSTIYADVLQSASRGCYNAVP